MGESTIERLVPEGTSLNNRFRTRGFASDGPEEFAWQKGRVPNGFWDIRANRVQYFDWLGEKCGFQAPQDWYAVRKSHFKMNCGGGLLVTRYSDSCFQALQDYKPDFEWLPWRFEIVPLRFWTPPENRRAYMQWLEQELGLKSADDWFSVSKSTFAEHHGGGFLRAAYRGSVVLAVREYIPDRTWPPWLFSSVPQSFWQDLRNRRLYMNWLGGRLGFSSAEDWYAVIKLDQKAGCSTRRGLISLSNARPRGCSLVKLRDDYDSSYLHFG